MRAILLFLSLIIGAGFSSRADIRLPKLVGDNMVLQRDLPIHVWGWADPGEKIEITFHGKSYQATADAAGNWEATLKKMKAGGPYEMVLSGNNRIELKNILVGDVWVCSGQSNMEWPVSQAMNPEEEIKNASYPKIRLFTVKKKTSGVPLDDVSGQWEECSPESVPGFSAVGYFFGREIHQSEGIPIGLINSSWGGTVVETWISKDGLQGEETFGPRAEAVKDLSAEEITQPNSQPTLLYNGMIHPLLNFPIKGAIWYQGESNAGRAYQYRDLFPRMILDWRNKWEQDDFPFLFVQLANFRKPLDEPKPSDWAELREAQDMTLAVKNTGMASAIDIGVADDIHPRNKQEVGRRLALSALSLTYGEKIVDSGPRFKSMKIKDGDVYIRFSSTGEGLKTKGGAKALGEFQLAGEDRQFHWAEAEIVNENTVKVHAEEVTQPVALRFAWQDNPSKLNLYNAEGLPANPFRTDEWPGITEGKK
ncbi:sialate O-acetylesterase [Anseongella ginsenosidimutans]|uniref:Sialate O-acetylesterase n=1 Tax=Anseongella ginsenosidimutans TaxID=496056 RepID=A0A4R3KWX3_9SPHI|nr:sialate O-acetylesterase [Anseongella ginsenosidimutans]QEC51645.1 sialate O-acetylesterase [Anseongella ginsenosidimutans]TCS88980.1 sialate O-acetylesterase [Anseongella ginsenosidimutans]